MRSSQRKKNSTSIELDRKYLNEESVHHLRQSVWHNQIDHYLAHCLYKIDTHKCLCSVMPLRLKMTWPEDELSLRLPVTRPVKLWCTYTVFPKVFRNNILPFFSIVAALVALKPNSVPATSPENLQVKFTDVVQSFLDMVKLTVFCPLKKKKKKLICCCYCCCFFFFGVPDLGSITL